MDYVVRGGNWYFDQLNLWRVLDEVTLPKLAFNKESFSPGGHHMAVEFPEDMEPLTASIKAKTDDPRIRSLYGKQPGDFVTATYYENLASFRDGSNKGRVITLKGLVTEVDKEAVKGLKSSMVTYAFSTVVIYRDIVDGRIIHQFDYFSGPGSTLVDGTNPFSAMASNLATSGGTAL